ncbi:hypothetical protein Tco_1030263 [Tanacetum coccineum]|uniref:Uncharacterized protein n=1 Tax=Tanacetum coccineum TaxID=301880 RepID=A0ABQ5G7J9_9ASTR
MKKVNSFIPMYSEVEKSIKVNDEAELKKHMEIVRDDDVAIDAIPLATKPPVIMLQGIDREDLQTLWKLVKAKHDDKRPKDEFERVLWGDLKVMFKPDRISEVWRSLQGYRVTIWKLFDSCGVHYVSTSIDQDEPSISIPSTQEQEQEHSLIVSQGFEESPKTPHFHDDPLHESLYENSTSQGSLSNVRPIHTSFESLSRWTKDHPISNVIGDPSRYVSMRKQLKTNAM